MRTEEFWLINSLCTFSVLPDVTTSVELSVLPDVETLVEFSVLLDVITSVVFSVTAEQEKAEPKTKIKAEIKIIKNFCIKIILSD